MSREQDLDRNHEASPYKLEQARKQGQTARSADWGTLAILCVCLVGFFALLWPALADMARLLGKGLGQAARVESTGAMHWIGQGFYEALRILAPLLLALVVVAVVAQLVQSRGLVFSTKPLKPDFTRLNPVQGFKKLLSVRLLYEAVKSVMKLTALIAVTWVSLESLLPLALQLSQRSTGALLWQLVESSGGLLAKLCAVLLVFTLADLMFTRWDFMRNLRMSRREMEDEHKNREGDPRIKNRLREIRLQFLQRSRSVRQVPQAQVVITNPTHVAVALKYEHGVTPAPLLVAKGAGLLAAQIRREARRAGVPIVHSPRLARALFKSVQQDGYVPQEWYPPVARILVWLRDQQALRQTGQFALKKASS